MTKLLNNKNCVITGASGEIGFSCVDLFIKQGANLILIYNKNSKKLLQYKDSKNIKLIKCNFENELEIKKTYKKINKIFHEVNVLINCAGIMEPQIYFLDENLKNVKRHLKVNTTSVIHFTKLLSRNMIRANEPSIINVCSIAANYGLTSLSNYSTSKGAIKAFTISSARELGPLGIRVNSVSPGIIKTKLHKKENLIKYKKKISLERLGSPDDVSGVILFLASHYSKYINGQDIKVDGQIKTFY